MMLPSIIEGIYQTTVDPMKRFLTLASLLILMLGAACGSSPEPLAQPDPTVAAPLLDAVYSGASNALNGESREYALTLSTDAEGDYVFSLDYLFVERSLRPTNRTGHWHYDGNTLTLQIDEQDGEPVDQPSLFFAVAGEQLVGTVFDKAQFDVQDFVLQRAAD